MCLYYKFSPTLLQPKQGSRLLKYYLKEMHLRWTKQKRKRKPGVRKSASTELKGWRLVDVLLLIISF